MTAPARRATLDDLDQLVPLFDAYRQFYGQHSDLIVARQFLNDRLIRNESVVLVAENDGGAAIGFCAVVSNLLIHSCRTDVCGRRLVCHT